MGVLGGGGGGLAGANGFEELGHVGLPGVGLGFGDAALLVLAARDDDPAVVGDEEGFLFAIEEDAVGGFRGVFLRAPDAVPPGDRALLEVELGGEDVGRGDLALEVIDAAGRGDGLGRGALRGSSGWRR